MDREAADIRAEIDRTRCEIERKIDRLEARAHDMDPRRYLPDYPLDRAIGAVLTSVGSWMVWRQYRDRADRRARLREALAVRW